jgi:hypothetical protein
MNVKKLNQKSNFMETNLIISTNSNLSWKNIQYLEFITKNGKELQNFHIDLKELFKNGKNKSKGLNKQDENNDFAGMANEKIEKVLTFGYRKTPEFLIAFVQAFDDQMLFLDTRTTVLDCVMIMTSPNLELVKEKIYLACQTNEFKYILEYLKPFFKSLTEAKIERSGIFISNKGNPITASCLYNCKIENLHNKKLIDTDSS